MIERITGSAGPRLVAENIQKSVAGKAVLDSVSFCAEPGRVTMLAGPSGAGKSVLLRIVAGLVRPASGTLSFDGKARRDWTGRVGGVLDAASGSPAFTAREFIAAMTGAGRGKAHDIDVAMESNGVHFAADQRLRSLSADSLFRVSMTAALLPCPTVLLIDDAGVGLDTSGVAWLHRLLRQCAGQGRTILITTRTPESFVWLADDVLSLEHGKLLRTETEPALSGSRCGEGP